MEGDSSTSESRRMAENFQKFYEQMEDESDRGSVLVSVSLLDEILTRYLKSKLAPSLEKDDELFDPVFSPFHSFSAKVDLAYTLGLLRPSIRSSLHLLRKVRNDFAHASDIKGFEHPSTQNRIRELERLNKRLLTTIIEVVNEANLKKVGSQEKINGLNDLRQIMGWRRTL